MPVCGLNGLISQTIVCVRVTGIDAILIWSEGRVVACERICPHEQADLSRGHLAGGRLFCPRHAASFDLRNGRMSYGWPGRPLRLFPARIGNDRFWDHALRRGGANTFALRFGSQSVTDTRSELGLRTDRAYALADGIFMLRSRFAWAYDFNPGRSVGATFQTLPGASFVVNGARLAQNSAWTTLAAEMKWKNGWSAGASFEGEFSDVTLSYAGKGIVRYTW